MAALAWHQISGGIKYGKKGEKRSGVSAKYRHGVESRMKTGSGIVTWHNLKRKRKWRENNQREKRNKEKAKEKSEMKISEEGKWRRNKRK